MASLTCLACKIAFRDLDEGRQHYKSDWHRYNLKRKVAQLQAVTIKQFEERQQQVQQWKDAMTADESSYCQSCNKAFSTTNSYQNHIQSKKHKETITGKFKKKRQKGPRHGNDTVQSDTITPKPQGREVEMDEVEEMDDSDAESWDSYDENTLGIEECLFCSFVSASLEDNVQHMTSKHSFFFPDAEYICDLEGLVTYLGEKIGAGHVCLWCNEKGKRFHSTKDVQRHMADKGHCKILHEGDVLLEYADFYDYTSSYPDGSDGKTDPDEVVDLAELESDGYSLTLPSGATIGHRSLMKFYQQNLVPHCRDPSKKVVPKMLAHYKALGWTGSTSTQIEKKVKDLQFMNRLRSRYHTHLGVKANDLRHRFRDPNGP